MNHKKGNKQLKEFFTYGIFGVLTAVLNLAVYQVLLAGGIDYRLSNLIAIVVTKLAAYVLNKNFVFHSRCKNFSELCMEFLRFVAGRGVTGLIDYFGLIVLVEGFAIPAVYGKYFISGIVILLNYVLSKKLVFKGGTPGDAE